MVVVKDWSFLKVIEGIIYVVNMNDLGLNKVVINMVFILIFVGWDCNENF